jgi:hypothetical protein
LLPHAENTRERRRGEMGEGYDGRVDEEGEEEYVWAFY